MRKTHNFGKILSISLIIVLMAACGVWAYKYNHDKSEAVVQSQPSKGDQPATKADQAQSEAMKSSTPSVSPANNSGQSAERKKVVVTITTWGPDGTNYSVSGFMEGIVETDGTCTLTMTKDGTTLTAHNPAFANASDTSCGAEVPASKLQKGTWLATLSYTSKAYTGKSSQEITIK
jgi:hypothetical protein